MRKNIFNPGMHNQIVFSTGVSALSLIEQVAILVKVRDFDNFNTDNDPYGEHDFGRIDFKGIPYYFKIDYYNNDLTAGSDDAANSDITRRVLTVMRTDEY